MKAKLCRLFLRALSLSLLVFVFTSCSGLGQNLEYFSFDGSPKNSNPEYQRTFPAVALSGYIGTNQQTREDSGRSGTIDLTSLSKGYVVAAATSAARAKFRVERDGSKYDYDLNNQGGYEVFPLVYGNGHYTFTIFINVEGNQYEYFLVAEADVELESEFAPFLVPNQVVNYNESSAVVTLSHTLTEHAASNLEVVQQIYYWVSENISYDTDKAAELSNSTGYVPNVEETLSSKKGICYDYAALVAAMLRANGIPCKLIKGDVQYNGQSLYHAWNMIWLEETGWIAVKVPSAPNEWFRIDLTFAAGGDASIAQFIGDGQNYTEIYVH